MSWMSVLKTDRNGLSLRTAPSNASPNDRPISRAASSPVFSPAAAASAALIVALTACGPTLRDRPELLESPFEPEISVHGIEHTYTRARRDSETYYLRSFIDKKTAATRHQVYVGGLYRYDWYAANDETATGLEFTPVGGSRRRYLDDFGAIVPEDKLRSRRMYGYAVKFYAKSGTTLVIQLTPRQIGAQLDAVDALRSRLSPGPAATGGPVPAKSALPTDRAPPR